MTNEQRDQLITEMHTDIRQIKGQVDVFFKKHNNIDTRFRSIDDRCAERGETLSTLKSRLMFLWIILFFLFCAAATALIKTLT